MKTTLAIILAVALVGCAGLPNDYDFSEPTNYTANTPTRGGMSLPRSIQTSAGLYLIVPNYSTGQIQAIIKTP